MTQGPSEGIRTSTGISRPHSGARFPNKMRGLLAAAAMGVLAVGCSDAPHPEPNLPFDFVGGDGDNDNNDNGSATSGAGAGNPDGSSSTTGSGAGGAEPSGDLATMKVYKINGTAPTDCEGLKVLASELQACEAAQGSCDEMQGNNPKFTHLITANGYPNAHNSDQKETFPNGTESYAGVIPSVALPQGIAAESGTAAWMFVHVEKPAAGSSADGCDGAGNETASIVFGNQDGAKDQGKAFITLTAKDALSFYTY